MPPVLSALCANQWSELHGKPVCNLLSANFLLIYFGTRAVIVLFSLMRTKFRCKKLLDGA